MALLCTMPLPKAGLERYKPDSAPRVRAFAPMADPSRQWLIDALRTRLLPALEGQGFVQHPLVGEDARSTEIRTSFPLGQSRRARAGGHDLVEIQLDRRPAFRLNLGVAPDAGILHAAGPVARDQIWVHYLPRYFELYQHPLFRRWFAMGRWSRAGAKAEDYAALVDRAVALLPEIDQTLAAGKPGPHVRAVG